MKICMLDIETAPADKDQIAKFEPEFEANKTLKDPVKIAEDLAKKKAAFYDKAALSAFTGKIIAIGLSYADNDGYCRTIIDNSDEKKALEEFIELRKKYNFKFITWNGIKFDIPFLLQRMWKYKLNELSETYTKNHTDLMVEFACGRYNDYISLKDAATLLEVGYKHDVLYYELIKEGKTKEAQDYLFNDLALLERIYERIML